MSTTNGRARAGSPRLGWLAVGQLCSFVISTIGFAVLARTLGPSPFAVFATLMFLYTVASLAVDLSPQGFLLVHGVEPPHRWIAWRLALTSGLAAALLVAVLALFLAPVITGYQVGPTEATMLGATVLVQSCSQIPRAHLLVQKRYKSAATADISGVLVSVLAAVGVSFFTADLQVLCLQLLLLTGVRFVVMVIAQTRSDSRPGSTSRKTMRGAVAYGLGVMPLNVSSYISRSLDTGLLPALIPASAAASYARSYQVVVSPITQLQLSIGGAVLERLARAGAAGDMKTISNRVWRGILALSGGAAILISLGAPLIALVLFGPKWPQAEVFIAAMSCALPTIAIATYFAWQLQLLARTAHSLKQLAIGLITPLGVLVSALSFQTQGAVIALVFLSVVTSCAAIMAHSRLLPEGVGRIRALTGAFVIWLILASIFLVTAAMSGFWGFAAW